MWCGVGNELDGSFYSWSEAVAVNGITLVTITVGQWSVRWFMGQGITVRVYWFCLSAKFGLPWLILQVPNGTAHGARRRQRARSALLKPR